MKEKEREREKKASSGPEAGVYSESLQVGLIKGFQREADDRRSCAYGRPPMMASFAVDPIWSRKGRKKY